MPPIKNEKLNKLVTKARVDFFTFCQLICRDEPEFRPFAKFQKLICDRIQNQLNTKIHGIREMFSVPPGYGKSTLLSQLLVAFLLGVNPRYKIILISYGAELSSRNARVAKYFTEKPMYKLIFPDTQVIGDRENPPFDTAQGGGIRATGRGGQINGFRADFILIDDILKGPDEAASDAIIKSIQRWYPTVVNSRLKPSGGILILSTRWTKRDLIGWLYEKSSRWNYINLEAICTNKEQDAIHREVGEALWPEYKTLESLLEARELNERFFQVVYQGNCTAAENTSIDVSRIRYIDKNTFEDPYIICSYDTASKTDIENDWTTQTIWEVSRDLKKAMLLDIVRIKVEFPDLLKLFDETNYLYSPSLNLVEDANSGVQLLQMRRKTQLIPSKYMQVDTKLAVADTFNVLLTDGTIKFKKHIAKMKDELIDLDEFPFGSNDDVTLSCLHFIRWFMLPEEAKLKNLVIKADTKKAKAILGKVRKRARMKSSSARKVTYGKTTSFH